MLDHSWCYKFRMPEFICLNAIQYLFNTLNCFPTLTAVFFSCEINWGAETGTERLTALSWLLLPLLLCLLNLKSKFTFVYLVTASTFILFLKKGSMAFLLRNFTLDQILNFIASSAYLTFKLMSVAVLYSRSSCQVSLLIRAAVV